MSAESLDASGFLSHLTGLNTWRRGGERAPHKPLLLLYALGRMSRHQGRLIPFGEAKEPLTTLLEEFGPPRSSYRPEYPFWRLANDGIWEVDWPPPFEVRESGADPSARKLLDHDVHAGFSREAFELLQREPHLREQAARLLLERNFPSSLHDEILTAVALEPELETVTRRARDPRFRENVLVAYEYRCGVCGFDLRLGTATVALDAAHIRWKQADGPDEEGNGIALCAMHHRLFDRGTFTLDEGVRLQVSQRVVGTVGLTDWLLEFHGRKLRGPQAPEQRPKPEHLGWHHREVFRGPKRAPPSDGRPGD